MLDPFGVNFGSILAPFGVFGGVLWRKSSQVGPRTAGESLAAKGGHKASQNRSKIDEKSMQKSLKNSAGFLHGLGSVFGRLWGCVWDPGPLILSVSCRRDANSQKFVFFMFGLTFL